MVLKYIAPAVLEIIDPDQYGAILKSSTIHAFISMIHQWAQATDGTMGTGHRRYKGHKPPQWAQATPDNISIFWIARNFKLYCVFLKENKLNANHSGIEKYILL